MTAVLQRVIERYGTAIIWRSQQGRKDIRGFFQPVTSRSWQKLKREVFALGEVPVGLYVYIGQVENEINPGDRLVLGRREYLIRRTEIIYDSKGPAYCWGLCVQKGGG